MQLLAIVILLLSSWYIWKLSSNFFDEETKKDFSKNIKNFKDQILKLKESFSKERINYLWEKYKEEGGALAKNNDK